MKYLIRIPVVYWQVVLVAGLLALSVVSVTAPAYALAPITQFAASQPITCSGGPTLAGISNEKATGTGERCLITSYVNPFVKVLAGLVAVFVVISIIIAGIQYSAAADDSSKVTGAKNRIRNAIIALLAYIFLLGFVKYLLPGGI
jgi:hypothetical protein